MTALPFVGFLYEPFELQAAAMGPNMGDISALARILDFPTRCTRGNVKLRLASESLF